MTKPLQKNYGKVFKDTKIISKNKNKASRELMVAK